MTAVAGQVECQLTVQREEEILGSANFLLTVEPAALKKGTPQAVTVPATLPFTDAAVLTRDRLGDVDFDGQPRPVDPERLRKLFAELAALLGQGVPVYTPVTVGDNVLLLRVTEVSGPDGEGGYTILYAPLRRAGDIWVASVSFSAVNETVTAVLEAEGYRHWVGTAAQYAALEPDNGTIYLILEAQ